MNALESMRRDMIAETKELLGTGLKPEYYAQMSAGFADVAERYGRECRLQEWPLKGDVIVVTRHPDEDMKGSVRECDGPDPADVQGRVLIHGTDRFAMRANLRRPTKAELTFWWKERLGEMNSDPRRVDDDMIEFLVKHGYEVGRGSAAHGGTVWTWAVTKDGEPFARPDVIETDSHWLAAAFVKAKLDLEGADGAPEAPEAPTPKPAPKPVPQPKPAESFPPEVVAARMAVASHRGWARTYRENGSAHCLGALIGEAMRFVDGRAEPRRVAEAVKREANRADHV